MIELKPDRNERDSEDRMTKKNLKKMKFTTYTNKEHIPPRWFNHRNFIIKHALLGAILYWVTS